MADAPLQEVWIDLARNRVISGGAAHLLTPRERRFLLCLGDSGQIVEWGPLALAVAQGVELSHAEQSELLRGVAKGLRAKLGAALVTVPGVGYRLQVVSEGGLCCLFAGRI